MNKLPLDTQVQIVRLLVEGNSLRATSRLTNTSINTVTRVLVQVGMACLVYHDAHVRGVRAKKVQCDEIWSFVYSKQKNVPAGKTKGAGDIWTWVAIDPDTKLVISWFVGNRDDKAAAVFMRDLAGRLANRIQLTTDGYQPYVDAVDVAFTGNVDYAQLIKDFYGGKKGAPRKYSPNAMKSIYKRKLHGSPDLKHVSTSIVERQNLTMRMSMRRFTRLTNGFSKKVENHVYAVALHFFYYNFCRIHQALRVTPAMEAGLTKDILEIEDILHLLNSK